MNSDKLDQLTIQSLKEIFKPTCEIDNDYILLDSFNELVDTLFQKPCRIEAYTGACIKSGSAKIRINLEEIEVTAGMMILIDPGKFVQIIETNNIEAKAFLVSEKFFQEMHIDIKSLMPLYAQCLYGIYLMLNVDESLLLESYFTLFSPFEKSHQDIFLKEAMYKVGSALAFSLASILSKQKNLQLTEISNKSRAEKIYLNFMDLITKFHKKERMISFYADKLAITPKYLTTIVKQVSHKSAAEWIDEFVILEAKNLIKYSDMSIQEISYELNFPTQSFFGKYFKHHTGTTPGSYRKQEDIPSEKPSE